MPVRTCAERLHPSHPSLLSHTTLPFLSTLLSSSLSLSSSPSWKLYLVSLSFFPEFYLRVLRLPSPFFRCFLASLPILLHGALSPPIPVPVYFCVSFFLFFCACVFLFLSVSLYCCTCLSMFLFFF